MERDATADVRALPLMKSGSSSTLNERGAITKDTMCAERFSEKCEENTCQVTGVACVPNGVANFEMVSTGPEGFSASVDSRRQRLSSVNFGQRSWVPVKDVNCLMWPQDQPLFRDVYVFFRRALHILGRRLDWLFLMHVTFFVWNLTILPTRTTPHDSGQDSFWVIGDQFVGSNFTRDNISR